MSTAATEPLVDRMCHTSEYLFILALLQSLVACDVVIGSPLSDGICCHLRNLTSSPTGAGGRQTKVDTADDDIDQLAAAIGRGDMRTAGLLAEKLQLAYDSSPESDWIVQIIFIKVCYSHDLIQQVDNLMQFAIEKLSVGHIGIGALAIFTALNATKHLTSPQGLYLAARIRPFASMADIEPYYKDVFDQLTRGLQQPVHDVIADWAGRVRSGENLEPILELERKSTQGVYNDFLIDGFNEYVVGSLLVPAVVVGHNNSIDAMVNLSRNFTDVRTSLSLLHYLLVVLSANSGGKVSQLLSTPAGIRLAFRLNEIANKNERPYTELPAGIRALVAQHPWGVTISQGAYSVSAGHLNYSPERSYGRFPINLDSYGRKRWFLESIDQGTRFRIKNADLPDGYLYAGENRFCTNNSRPLFVSQDPTRMDGPELWEIVPVWDPEMEKFTIRNVFYNEYLYAAGQAFSICETWRVKGELPTTNASFAYWTFATSETQYTPF